MLNYDLLHIMEHVDSVSTLKTLKLVSKDFTQPARNTLTNVEWLQRNNVSLTGTIKHGCSHWNTTRQNISLLNNLFVVHHRKLSVKLFVTINLRQ